MNNRRDVDPDAPPNVQAFADWLASSPRGQLPADLSAALTECVDATQMQLAKSSFTMTVSIEPSKAGFAALDVTADIKTKPARPPAPTNVYWATDDGGLTRDDPNQPQLPMEAP